MCGNCLEICGKLDSIRTAGFPETGATAAGGDPAAGTTTPGDEASNPSGPLPSRPRSEPLPESSPAAGGLWGTERRPGTAESGTIPALTSVAAGPVRREEPRGGAGDGGAAGDESGGGEGGCSPSGRSGGNHSPTGGGTDAEGPAPEPGVADVPREGQGVGAETATNEVDRILEGEHDVPGAEGAKPARIDDRKVQSTRLEKVKHIQNSWSGTKMDAFVPATSSRAMVVGAFVGSRETKHITSSAYNGDNTATIQPILRCLRTRQ